MPLLAILVFCLSTPADTLGAFEGTLVERDSTPVAFANVVVVGTRRGALADEHGRFRVFGIPPGRQVVRYQSIGFSAASDTIEFKPGETVQLRRVLTQEDHPPLILVCPCANRPKWRPPI